MKMRVDKLQKAMMLENRLQLTEWLKKEMKISHQAVYKWGKYVPELRVYQLLERRPELRRLVE